MRRRDRGLAWALVLFAGACARGEVQWERQLQASDPFERTLAAIALFGRTPAVHAQALQVLLEAIDRTELELAAVARRQLLERAEDCAELYVAAWGADPFLTIERRRVLEESIAAGGPAGAQALLNALAARAFPPGEAVASLLLACGPKAREVLRAWGQRQSDPMWSAFAEGVLQRATAGPPRPGPQ